MLNQSDLTLLSNLSRLQSEFIRELTFAGRDPEAENGARAASAKAFSAALRTWRAANAPSDEAPSVSAT